MPEATVTVTYERLTDAVNTNLVRTFTSIADAEADVNAEKKANTITGAVSIDVKYTNPIITDRVGVNHSDKQIAAITVAGTKTWIDKAGMTGKHPDITINLLKDGVKVDSRVLKDGETTYEFKDLPSTTSNGTPYVYTVEEESVPGYTAEYDTATPTNITNRFIGGGDTESGKNEPPKDNAAVKTGDSANMMVYSIMMLLAVVCALS